MIDNKLNTQKSKDSNSCCYDKYYSILYYFIIEMFPILFILRYHSQTLLAFPLASLHFALHTKY